MILSSFQRQSIINQIRPMFAIYNGNNPAPSFIENLWANMTPEQLYTALGNFTRMSL